MKALKAEQGKTDILLIVGRKQPQSVLWDYEFCLGYSKISL